MLLPLLILATAQPNLLNYSIEQWRSTPKMQIEDAYKWLFQAALGGEHAVTDDSGPRQWLNNEWPTLTEPKPNEPERQKLTPDGKLIRVNLRPYRARGGDQEFMLAIFVASAQQFYAKKSLFVKEWKALGTKLQQNKVQALTYNAWQHLDQAAKKQNYPAIDHSRAYEKQYDPAYRVVLGSLY